VRARAVILAAALVAVFSACGGSSTSSRVPKWPFRVNLLSLEADAGFPAAATSHVTVRRVNGKLFARLVRLVPRPPPAALTAKVPGETICVPVILTIRLGDGHRHAERYVYRGCQRPPSLRPLLRAMCPLLRRPGFCARYRRELTGG
jgi:hypothetical protein